MSTRNNSRNPASRWYWPVTSTVSGEQPVAFPFRVRVADHDGRKAAVLYCVSCDTYRRQVDGDVDSAIGPLTGPQAVADVLAATDAHVCPPEVRRA